MFEEQTPEMQELLTDYLAGAVVSGIEAGMAILSRPHEEPFQVLLLVLVMMQDRRSSMAEKARAWAAEARSDTRFSSWERSLVDVALGEIDHKEALDIAEHANVTEGMHERPKLRRIENNECQVLYWDGARLLVNGDAEGAAARFGQAARLGYRDQLERRLAVAQLEELGFPPSGQLSLGASGSSN